jgi:hypothetical protein
MTSHEWLGYNYGLSLVHIRVFVQENILCSLQVICGMSIAGERRDLARYLAEDSSMKTEMPSPLAQARHRARHETWTHNFPPTVQFRLLVFRDSSPTKQESQQPNQCQRIPQKQTRNGGR